MRNLVIKLIGAAILATLAFAAIYLPPTLRYITGLTLTLASLLLLIIGRRQLGKSFPTKAGAKALVKTGLYSKLRHPLYLFVDLLFLGLIVAFDVSVFLVIWGVFVVAQSLQAEREERVLTKAFGQEYTEYMARTWF